MRISDWSSDVCSADRRCCRRSACEAVAGTVRLGMPTSYSTSVLSAVLTRFAEVCPDVEVTVSCAQGLPLQAALAAGELDLIVFTAEDRKSTRLNSSH